MSMLKRLIAASGLTLAIITTPAMAEVAPSAPLESYERLLPLEGGSNFRDLGGYKTEDGKTVRRGLLFRSGVMAGLTEKDQEYLQQFDFQAVVDFRSDDELELYPNRWVQHDKDIDYRQHSYSMAKMMSENKKAGEKIEFQPEVFYRAMPVYLEPQMKLYFEELLEGEGAVAVNCSAGQDRTGFASAVLLSALGVPREVVVEDYLLSTQYRRPEIERGNLDLNAAAKDNAFAKMMLRYADNEKATEPQPLLTADNTPFIAFALDQINQDYGSMEGYLKTALALNDEDLQRLKALYLQ